MTTNDSRVQQLPTDALDSLLQALYRRTTCPHPDTLLDYSLRRLAPTNVVTLRQHLALCHNCTRELDDLATIAVSAAPAPARVHALTNLLKRLRNLVSYKPILTGILQPPELNPAMALRGHQDTEHRAVYHVGDYRISLTIADNHPIQDDYQIEGEIIDQTAPERICSGTVYLIAHDEVVLQIPLDDMNFFMLENVQIEVSTLLLELAEHSLWIQEIPNS